MKRTHVKVVVVRETADTPNWPCINHDANKELKRIMAPLTALNPDMDFDVVSYTNVQEAEADYDNDLKIYDGVLVLLMTLWKGIDLFYARQSKGGIPTIIADVPYCGSGSALVFSSRVIRAENLPVPLLATLNYNEIAHSVKIFDVLAKLKQTTILIISSREDIIHSITQMQETWGFQYVLKNSKDVNEYLTRVDMTEAVKIAKCWCRDAIEIREASESDIMESAALHIAIRDMMKDTDADAVTIDCLTLSYAGEYENGAHMYPCLSHFEMLNRGTVAVCEADIPATVTSLIVQYLTDRPGFVSDPLIDTSSNQVIYAHCVGCTKVYGCKDARTCQYAIRSHAEDNKGASVQIIFPLGEQVTTTIAYSSMAAIHSGKAVGNVGLQEACRSKLAAECDAQTLLDNWAPSGSWHRVTVYGDYRKLLMQLYKIKGLAIVEEDKE